MSLRKACLMLVVLIALGAYVYFIELAQQREEVEKKKLFTFDKEDVTAVVLTYPDTEIHLNKNADETWQITQPIKTDADQTTVDNLVGTLVDAEITRTLDDVSEDLAVYGLDAPVVKLHVSLKDGQTLPLVSIGKDTPVGFSVYVQREGEAEILLTRQVFRLGMKKELKDLRDKTIIAFRDDEVKKIEITPSDQPHIVLSKGDTAWTLESPTTARADETAVRTFLSSLRGMRAQDFIEQPLLESEEYGLAPPQLAISLTLGEESASKEILIGGEKSNDQGTKQRYVKRGEKETLFLVGDWVLRDLSKGVDDFRDKTVAHFAPDHVVKVEVTRQDGDNFELVRGENEQWEIDTTLDGTLKEAALSEFVADLNGLRGFEIAADNPSDLSLYGLHEPALRIDLYDEAEAKLATILAGQKEEDGTKKVFAMAEGGSTVFVLRDYIFERLDRKPTDFWEKPAEEAEGADSGADDAERGEEAES